MYCPKCKINTGDEEFCENCGTETISSLEINKGSSTKKDTNSSTNKVSPIKMDIKKLVRIGIISVIAIVLVSTYGSLKFRYSPDEVVKRYVNNITTGKEKEAFQMLDIQDGEFVNAEQFKEYINTLNIENKESIITPLEKNNQLYNVFGNEGSYSNIVPKDIKIYSVQMGTDIYSIATIKKGKTLGIFDNWLIGTEGITDKWEITAPKGSKIYVDGKEINNINEDNSIGVMAQSFFPEKSVYTISDIFPNEYEIIASLEGAKEIKKVANSNNSITDLVFEPTEELENELIKVAEEFIKLYYKKADTTEFKGITHDEFDFSNINNDTNIFEMYKSKSFKKIDIEESYLDDIEHARLDIISTFDYEQEEIADIFTGETEITTGTSTETFNLFFKKVDNKWMIIDSGYLY